MIHVSGGGRGPTFEHRRATWALRAATVPATDVDGMEPLSTVTVDRLLSTVPFMYRTMVYYLGKL